MRLKLFLKCLLDFGALFDLKLDQLAYSLRHSGVFRAKVAPQKRVFVATSNEKLHGFIS